MLRRLRERLGLRRRPEAEGVPERLDRAVMARSLMYLLAAVGGLVLVSTAIPDAPLAGAREVPVLVAIAFALSLGLFVGFDRLPIWGYHALLLSGVALISWAIYADGDGRSPYAILYIWLIIYAAFFFTPIQTAVQVVAVLGAYGGVMVELSETTSDPALQFTMTASGIVLAAALIQALTARLDRLMERVQEKSRTDPATGLYNSGAFVELLANEVERARRSGNRLAVVLTQLDNFAAAGKGSADQPRLLTAVGKVLSGSPRQIDTAARLGPGRFAVLLPYTDEHGAQIMAERMRGALAEIDAQPRLRPSIGVASFPRHGAAAEPVLQAAESALAEAEQAGGDRVIVYSRRGSMSRPASVTLDSPDAG